MAKRQLTPELLAQLADRFKALAEPNRLAILAQLRTGERTVGELVERTQLGQANVSKHLNVLHRYGFVQRRKDGLNVYYYLTDDEVFRICDLMCGRLEQDLDVMRSVVTGRRRARSGRP